MDSPFDPVTISIDEVLKISAPSTYLVRCHGDSMTGVGIHCGDLLVVDRSIDATVGRVVIGVVNSEPMVKLLDRQGGMYILRSSNPAFPNRYVLEGDEFSVWGVVAHSIRAHERQP
ncbi:LexA family protein [Pseudomonas sp. UBA4194]|uniref:LexA family protein n=1 Tax=Pseudomonas sp. UBA4194 TaxID=1947317 RepID=UPI0025D871E8|nr:S24 family peptidase [Pseudomonas sp. UBA4194]